MLGLSLRGGRVMAILQVSLPRTTYWHDGPGTYRSDSGDLVHVRRDFAGRYVVQTEDPATSEELSGAALIKLSDDPLWPDLRPADALGADL